MNISYSTYITTAMSPLFFNLVNSIGNLEWSGLFFFFLNKQLMGLEFQEEREINYPNVISSISEHCILQTATRFYRKPVQIRTGTLNPVRKERDWVEISLPFMSV